MERKRTLLLRTRERPKIMKGGLKNLTRTGIIEGRRYRERYRITYLISLSMAEQKRVGKGGTLLRAVKDRK